MIDNHSEAHLAAYIEDQSLAEKMIPIVGDLYRSRGVIITVFGRKLMNASIVKIIRAHRVGKHMIGEAASLKQTSEVLSTMSQMNLGASRIDIGQLAAKFHSQSKTNLFTFLSEELKSVNHGKVCSLDENQDVVLYGFGRIGRILARLLIERTTSSNHMRLRAVVVRGGREGDLEKRASLLRRDSVHGPFNGSVTVDTKNNAIIANGNYIQFIYANSPEEIDYTEYGIENALIVDNTGIFKDEEALSRHLKAKGSHKVLLTAPAGGNVKNIVYGVNEEIIEDSDKIVCAASCTTNAITPMLKVINDKFGIDNGHVETVHSYTNDQNLIDNYHKAERRGRSAPLNMVLTSTGAAKAVVKALPELDGKLTGNAIRVPTPNVSMAVMNLFLSTPTSRDEINKYIRDIALDSKFKEQIAYSASSEVVSSDLVGTPEPGVFDSVATICEDRRCVLYLWYDNEYGYTTQVLRVMRHMSNIQIESLPVPSTMT